MNAPPSKPSVVIGSGPAGYVCAIRLAQLGKDVVCVEKGELGGVCLNVGCIPSKALISASQFVHECKSAEEMGIKVGSVRVDVEKLIDWKESVVGSLTKGIGGLFDKHKIRHAEGTARLSGPSAVEVDGETIEAEAVVIATGSRPVELGAFPFSDEDVWSSTGALSPKAIPDRLLVIGGGYIGLEMGSVWRRLGAEVTVVEFLDRITPGMDAELARHLQRALDKQGLQFRLSTKVTAAKKARGGVELTLEPAAGGEAETLKANVVLLSIGRRPFTDGLGLAEAGVTVDERGFVPVDEDYQTNVAGIFAIGDVLPDRPMLAHKAEEEGVVVAEKIAGHVGAVNYDAIPGVVYTWPEVATVGQSEEQLKEAGIAYNKGRFSFAANSRARASGEAEGFVKLLADAETDRLLGAHIIGPDAGTLIAELVLAIEMCASSEDVALTCHAHPTLNEAVKEAALAVTGKPLNM